LLEIASSIDLDVRAEELSKQKVVNQVLELEIERNNSFSVECSAVDCPAKVDIKEKLTSIGSQQKVDSDHIGCSFSAVNGNSLDVSGTAGSNCQRSSKK